MICSEIRRDARENLKGKWGKVVCIMLAYFLISFSISFLVNRFEGSIIGSLLSIAEIIISTPLSFSLIISFIKLKNGEDVNAFDFLTHLPDNFKRAWTIYGNVLLKLLLPTILTIILTILIYASISVTVTLSSGLFVSAMNASEYQVNSSDSYIVPILFTLFATVGLIIVSIWATIKSLLYALVYPISYDNPHLTSKQVVERSAELMNGNRAKYFLLQFSFIGWAILAAFTFGIGMLWLTPYMEFATLSLYDSLIGKSVPDTEE